MSVATGEKKSVPKKRRKLVLMITLLCLSAEGSSEFVFPQEIIRGGDLEGFSFFDDDADDVVCF